MNAAARLVHQNTLTRHLVLVHLTRRQLTIVMLVLAVIVTALSIVYVTHLSRELHAKYQHDVNEKNQLHSERGQLLLERSTWMMQARIQQVAEKKLGMVTPNAKSVVVISE